MLDDACRGPRECDVCRGGHDPAVTVRPRPSPGTGTQVGASGAKRALRIEAGERCFDRAPQSVGARSGPSQSSLPLATSAAGSRSSSPSRTAVSPVLWSGCWNACRFTVSWLRSSLEAALSSALRASSRAVIPQRGGNPGDGHTSARAPSARTASCCFALRKARDAKPTSCEAARYAAKHTAGKVQFAALVVGRPIGDSGRVEARFSPFSAR